MSLCQHPQPLSPLGVGRGWSPSSGEDPRVAGELETREAPENAGVRASPPKKVVGTTSN